MHTELSVSGRGISGAPLPGLDGTAPRYIFLRPQRSIRDTLLHGSERRAGTKPAQLLCNTMYMAYFSS